MPSHLTSHCVFQQHVIVYPRMYVDTYIHGNSTKMAKSMACRSFLYRWITLQKYRLTRLQITKKGLLCLMCICFALISSRNLPQFARYSQCQKTRRKMCFTVLKTPPAPFFSRDSFSHAAFVAVSKCTSVTTAQLPPNSSFLLLLRPLGKASRY